MADVREFTAEDVPNLEKAIENDKFHPGQWTLEAFESQQGRPVAVSVIEDEKGPIAFVRYTKSLRLSCIWVQEDKHRNVHAIIQGLRDAANRAKESGFTEIIIQTDFPDLAKFFEKVMKMERSQGEYILYLDSEKE